MDLELMLGLRDHINIEKHTPGSLKLKFGMELIVNPKVVKYVKVNGFGPPKGEEMPGMTGTRFNPLTRCMTISYDEEILKPELLQKLFTCECEDEFQHAAQELADAAHFDLATFLH
ncbi:hypothetical protein [Desulfovibrio sp. JC010]|uniref:hypothetical protein n=1 Tax=Desulfovibrio sp. JC010 TaxID=2593641 RepID=UPI0013D6CDA4|nr:hypothetical protein [Desulfovibrio sp. JC010]NDV28560.1 hypothetical protein [Desulfovibrio sp. JC010]